MISDVLFEAEKEIQKYLAWDPCPYGPPGDPMREQIEQLLRHMQAIRWQPGLDSWPIDSDA